MGQRLFQPSAELQLGTPKKSHGYLAVETNNIPEEDRPADFEDKSIRHNPIMTDADMVMNADRFDLG